jgi:hypothetical protein
VLPAHDPDAPARLAAGDLHAWRQQLRGPLRRCASVLSKAPRNAWQRRSFKRETCSNFLSLRHRKRAMFGERSLWAGCDTVSERQRHHRKRKHEREQSHPHKPRIVGFFFDIEIPSKRVNGGNYHNSPKQPLFHRS